ncbi:MAG TPA: hypothetical protein VFE37_03010 [Chloroflexota bacterium]|nr:hypothetical protein [Chloroflexota bacterium]
MIATGEGSDERAVARAYRLVWLALGLFVGGTALGLSWDRAWHATRPFESFWSPPHLLIYTVLGLTTLVVAHLAARRPLRGVLGLPLRVPAVPYPLPGALVLAGGGLATIWLGGALDSVWHTAFGLDETGWSLPHALLGHGLLLTYLGLVAARLALRPRRPLGVGSAVVLAVLALWFGVGGLLGPLGHNPTVEWVRAAAALPALAGQEPAQHTFRIYEAWNLARSHPAFVPLAAFVVSAGLAVARGIVPGGWALVLVALLASLLPLAGDYRAARFLGVAATPAAWLPLPYVPAVLALLATQALGATAGLAWGAAGIVFGLCAAGIWGAPAALALAAGPLFVGGEAAGRWALGTLQAPRLGRATILVVLLAVGLPLLSGALDLYLRAHTP